MTARRSILAALCAAVTLALAGCGGSQGGGGAGSSAAAAVGKASGTVTFWVQSADPFLAAYRDIIRGFERENPDARVQLVPFPFADFQSRLTATLPVGRGPDVLEGYTPWMTGYMRNGQLSEVPASVGTAAQIAKRYYASSLGQLEYRGAYYGLPANVAAGSTRVLLANDDVVAKAGVELPGKDASFEDWIATWKRLTKRSGGKVTVEGLGQSCGQPADQFISYLMEYGGSLLTADGRRSAFNDAAGTRALSLLGRLSREEEVDSSAITDANCIPQGVAATGYRGTWAMPEYRRDFPDFKGSYHRMPLPPGATQEVWQGGSGWGTFVPARGDNVEAAWAFVKYLDDHRDRWIAKTGEIPANRRLAAQVAEEKPELYGAYFPILGQSRNAYTAGDYFEIYAALSDMATSVTTGRAEPAGALASAQKRVDEHLKQWWSQYPGS
jgi:multiple sugar transport system substrate-binding protein